MSQLQETSPRAGASGVTSGGGGGGGTVYDHQITQGVRLGTNGYLKRTPSGAGNRATWTFSTWIKLGQLGLNSNADQSGAILNAGTSGNQDGFYRLNYETTKLFSSSAEANFFFSTAQYRDVSGWYHVVWKQGSGTATVYVNGVAAAGATASVSGNTAVNNSVIHCIGGASNSLGEKALKGYLAETIMIDGTALGPDSFGETVKGCWIPKDASGLTFGTNGFHLDYADSSALGNDVSGNNNDWTTVNLSASDKVLDSPTFSDGSNGGNMCTWNPLNSRNVAIPTEGNLSVDYNGDLYNQIRGTMGIGNSGKWYMELYKSGTYATYPAWGICDQNQMLTKTRNVPGYYASSMIGVSWDFNSSAVFKALAYSDNYDQGVNLGSTADTYVNTAQIVGMAIDLDNNKIFTHINGSWDSACGNPSSGGGGFNASGLSGVNNLVPVLFPNSYNSPNYVFVGGFGADSTFGGLTSAGSGTDVNGFGNFKYAVPTGYGAICQGNQFVAETIDPAKTDSNFPQKLFGAVPYTGSGGTQTITGAGSKPDFTWIKNRGASGDNVLMDSTRGAYGTNDYYYQRSNTTALQDHTTDFHNFASDGFIVGGTGTYFNASGNTFISFNWRANGGSLTTNTTGSINSSVQADPSGGFSIVKWTGTSNNWSNAVTVGHGLSSAPTCILAKKYLGNADEWVVFFSTYGLASTGGATAAHASLVLNSTSALYTNQSYKSWGGVMPTSSVFTVDGNNLNGASDTIIAYCFANTAGYIKSGTYVGNGNNIGQYIYTGFRPSMVLVKELVADNWMMYNDKTFGYNVGNAAQGNEQIYPDLPAAAESDASRAIDIYSNGFMLRTSNATGNADAGNYVYLAIAKNPFKYSTGR